MLYQTEIDALDGVINTIEHEDDLSISDRNGITYGISYLRAFGYFGEQSIRSLTLGDVFDAIKHFQTFFGINANGHMDASTIRAMVMPRCGVPDIFPMRQQATQDGAMPIQGRWNKRKLRYAVQRYVNGLSVNDQHEIIRLAWKSWSDVCDLTFEQISDATSADIVISTGGGARDQFDGPSGTLAWAYLPTGDDRQLLMRFDIAETWVKDPATRGILMLNVAAHEFGHLLGLDHSKVNSALMAPFYSPAVAKPQNNDDVRRIQSLYGPAKDVPVTPPATPTIPGDKSTTITIVGDVQSISIPGYRVIKLG